MVRVTGGGDDALLLDKAEPLPPGPGEELIVEYYAPALDHYFVTGYANEIAVLDAGVRIPGWQRTGYTFKGYAPETPAGTPACRFFGRPGIGPNTHFYTGHVQECAGLKANPLWTYEGIGFRMRLPANDACPALTRAVYRLYNNPTTLAAVNHRYTTDGATYVAMIAAGWTGEGVALCAK